MTLKKKLGGPILLTGMVLPGLLNCNGLPGVPGADCPALKDGNFAALNISGGADVKAKVTGFLEAVYNLDKFTAEMELQLIASCKEIGKAVGMDEAALSAEPGGGEGAKKVCQAVTGQIKAKLDASGGAKVSLEYTEPKCYVSVDAMMSCLSGCGAAVEPGKLDASCEGGEISGKCDAECKGACTVEAGAQCEGKCEGECKGDCAGTCEAKDASGKCAGKCDGTCKGTCGASCKMEGKADCQGSCSGGCSADVKEPKCSGEFKPPNVDPSCHLQCAAKTASEMKCDPPGVMLKLDAKGDAKADLEAMITGLEAALPKILEIQLGAAEKVKGTIEGVVSMGADMPAIAQSAGLQAVSCVAMAVGVVGEASAAVDVNVQASASVSGSVGGST
jgi:hypothetical protein